MTPLADSGYDFGETGPDVLYLGLDEADFRRARLGLLGEPLFPEVIRAPELATWAAQWSHGEGDPGIDPRSFFRRVALVGCKVVIAPTPAYDVAHRFNGQTEAWRGAADAVSLLGEHAGRAGVSVALEPSGDDGGLVATVEEAWVLAEEVGHTAVGVTLDVSLATDLADIAAADTALKHVSLPLPKRYGGSFDTTTCLDAIDHLMEFGYEGRVSITADWLDVRDHADDLLAELRRLTK